MSEHKLSVKHGDRWSQIISVRSAFFNLRFVTIHCSFYNFRNRQCLE